MILVIALGNAYRADDGVGLALARRLAEAAPAGAALELEIVEAHGVLPEHADAIATADAVLFLDASVRGQPGEIRAGPLVPRAPRPAVLHALTPEDVLGIAQALHGRVPPAAMITVAGRDFAFAEALSPEVEAALPEALRRALELLETLRGG